MHAIALRRDADSKGAELTGADRLERLFPHEFFVIEVPPSSTRGLAGASDSAVHAATGVLGQDLPPGSTPGVRPYVNQNDGSPRVLRMLSAAAILSR